MWQSSWETIKEFLSTYIRDHKDVADFSYDVLVTPWGKFSSVQVMLAFILIFLMLYVYSHLCMVDDMIDLKKKLDQTASDVKTIKTLACDAVLQEDREPQKAEKVEKEEVDSSKYCRSSRSPQPSKPIIGQRTNSGSLAEKLAFIAKELSSEKLKPDKEKEIIKVLEALIEEKTKGEQSMEKNEKSMVKEIGIFRLFIIGSLITVLTNLLTDAWKKIKYRFDEEESKKDDC